MKKIILILLILVMTLQVVACGGGNTETEGGSKETNAPALETESQTGGRYDAAFDRSSVADDIGADVRFNGETVTFFTRNDQEHWKYEMDVDAIMNDTLYDAIYYRNKTVEERLGITIDTVQQAGGYAVRQEWNDTLRTAVNTQSDDYDSAAIYLSTGSALAVEGMFYNVIDFPNINLEKPWWNQSIQEELTLFSTLYYLAGDIAVTETTETFCLFYNKALFEKYYGAEGINLYNVIDQKKWTLDYMYDLVSPIHEDLNGNGIVDDGDIAGINGNTASYQQSWNDAWVASCGIDITTKVNGVPELSFYSERTIRAFEAVKRVILLSPGTLVSDSIQVSKFADGYLMFCKSNVNGGSGFREMKDPYGILPLPMLDEEQGGYSTTVGNVASLIVILSSLPDSRKELVGATLELMAAESYKQVTPEYYEVALKTKYAESPEDSKLYDLILNSVKFSFGYCYSTESLGGIGALFRILGNDIAQKYDENDDVYYEKLQTLIDGLDEAAFKAMSK